MVALSEKERQYFADELALHESNYLVGTTPLQQSGFGRDQEDWERYRRVITAPIQHDGSFLDIGCANGLLMESVVAWTRSDGYAIEPYGLDISERLVALARQRLPQWRDRIHAGNALEWVPTARFDFVRTELVYVPASLRRRYVEHLLAHVVALHGLLIVCAYGSSRPEGARAEPLVDELGEWPVRIERVDDVTSREHGFVITRAVTLSAADGR